MTEEQKTWYVFEGDDIVTFFLRVRNGAIDRDGNKFNAGLKLSPKSPNVQEQAEPILLELQAKAAIGELKVKFFECEVITKEEYEKEFPEETVEPDREPELYIKKPGHTKRRLF
jgi:hypothetical protein